MKKLKIGEVTGGGTLCSDEGEPLNCDVEIECKPKELERLKGMLTELPLPKGSGLLFADSEERLALGDCEGLGIYLDGTDLPDEVYASSDTDAIIDNLDGLFGDNLVLYNFWQGNRETALYFYGKSFEEMKAAAEKYAVSCPLFEKSRMVRLC